MRTPTSCMRVAWAGPLGDTEVQARLLDKVERLYGTEGDPGVRNDVALDRWVRAGEGSRTTDHNAVTARLRLRST